MKKFISSSYKSKSTTLFMLPSLLFISVFFIAPLVLNFLYSFTDWNTYTTKVNFIGLGNFFSLLKDNVLIKVTLNTLIFAAVSTVYSNVLALFFALVLEKTNRINSIFRTIFFIPVLLSLLATGFLWKGILAPEGALNQILSFIFQHQIDTGWLGVRDIVLYIVVIIQNWKWLGFGILVYVAGLNSIPQELIEAAKIEGASYMQILRKIKLPLIGPAFTFSITLSLIGGLSAFDIIMALTGGGPGLATQTINIKMLKIFAGGRFGEATALSLLLFILIILIAIPLITYLRRREIEL